MSQNYGITTVWLVTLTWTNISDDDPGTTPTRCYQIEQCVLCKVSKLNVGFSWAGTLISWSPRITARDPTGDSVWLTSILPLFLRTQFSEGTSSICLFEDFLEGLKHSHLQETRVFGPSMVKRAPRWHYYSTPRQLHRKFPECTVKGSEHHRSLCSLSGSDITALPLQQSSGGAGVAVQRAHLWLMKLTQTALMFLNALFLFHELWLLLWRVAGPKPTTALPQLQLRHFRLLCSLLIYNRRGRC